MLSLGRLAVVHLTALITDQLCAPSSSVSAAASMLGLLKKEPRVSDHIETSRVEI